MAKLAQKRGRAILDDAKARIGDIPAGEVTTRLRFGDIVETVAETEADADMVLIGKRGEAADFASMHLGSNLERIVRSCRQPVFVASRALKPIDRFLVAFDGGTSSMKAVDHVARDPLFSGLDCLLLMVGSESIVARRKLEGGAAMLRSRA